MNAPVALPETTSTPGLSEESLRRLVRAVRDLAACRDVPAVVEVVRHAARELVRADGATFVLRDGEQCHYVDEDAIEPLWRGQRFPMEACVSGWAMIHELQAVISDVEDDVRVPFEAYRPTFVRSMVMTPVRSDRGVAAIGTYWAHRHHASPEELEVLQALADTTAVALENARTLEGLESLVADRTSELSASNRDLAAFAHLAAHDLKAPLTTVLGHTEILALDEHIQSNPASLGSLEAVRRQALRMAEMIDGVLSYSTAATTALEVEPIDTAALVTDVLGDLAGTLADASARVDVQEDLPRIVGCRALLERVVQNLITNAVAYGGAEGHSPRVAIEGGILAGSPWLSVSDDGRGVLTRERDSIFEMFGRGTAGTRSAGSGIGLAFARRAVERHGGTLTLDDAPGRGARFTVRLTAPPTVD